MKTLRILSITAILAAGLMAGAEASTLSSKANLVSGFVARPATSVAATPIDTAAISSKADAKVGTSEQVKVSRTQDCSKTMDVASNICEIHCR